MKKFMLASRVFLAIIFLIVIYLIYNPFDGRRDNDNKIKNSIPQAVAGTVDTRVTLLRGGEAHLDGQSSFDPDGGEIVNYRWKIVDAPHQDLLGRVIYDGPQAQAPDQKYDEQDIGAWVYELEVTDDEGDKNRDVKNIFVQAEVTSIIKPLKKLAGEVSFLTDGDIVLGVDINGEAMAYPAKNVYPHGVVNDTIGGETIVVVFCEACQTGAVKSRTVNNQILTFITFGGTLEEENFIIKDRETNSTWHAAYGTAESGSLKGKELEDVDFVLTTWEEWVKLNPNTLVLMDGS